MISGAGSKIVPALVLTNLWTLVLLFLAWNYSARHEAAQSITNVGEWLGLDVPPDGEIGDMGKHPLTAVPDDVDGVAATRPALVPAPVPAPVPLSLSRDPNLPAFCPECGEGDALCAKYGLVSPLHDIPGQC